MSDDGPGQNAGLKCPNLLTLKALPPTSGDAILLPGHGNVLDSKGKVPRAATERELSRSWDHVTSLSDESYESKARLKKRTTS